MKIPTHEEIMNMQSINELESLMQLAIGKVFRMLDRPNKHGDSDVFDKCSMIVKSCGERLDILQIKNNIETRLSKEIPHNHSISMYF